MLVTAGAMFAAAIAVVTPAARAQYHEADPAAMQALDEVVKAYRARPAWKVKSSVTYNLVQGEVNSEGQPVEAEIIWSQGGKSRVTMKGFTVYLGDGNFTAVHEATDDAYFSTPDNDSIYYSLLSAFLDLPYPHLAIAFGEPEVDDFFCMQVHGKAPYLRPTGVETIRKDGADLTRIKLSSDFSTMTMDVDPRTKLIRDMRVESTNSTFVAQPDTKAVYTYTLAYDTYEDAPMDAALLAFDPGDRQRVDMLGTLLPEPVAAAPAEVAGGNVVSPEALVGQPAPDVLLATVDGNAFDLDDKRGTIIVLDFWATWCPPCVKALPKLHSIQAWAKENDFPVEVIPVNVFEGAALRGADDTPDARTASVERFWKRMEFTLPVAMDFTDEVGAAYGVSGIPATFIIAPDGTVHAQHSGTWPTYEEDLRAEIADLVELMSEGL
ncbi:MAG: TlpA family protein disulfide reductase [Planctomycetota bacterium]|jgi:thiol-disulfide isomerase/thioredoxin